MIVLCQEDFQLLVRLRNNGCEYLPPSEWESAKRLAEQSLVVFSSRDHRRKSAARMCVPINEDFAVSDLVMEARFTIGDRVLAAGLRGVVFDCTNHPTRGRMYKVEFDRGVITDWLLEEVLAVAPDLVAVGRDPLFRAQAEGMMEQAEKNQWLNVLVRLNELMKMALKNFAEELRK